MSALVKFRKKFGAFSLSVDFEAENEVLALLGGSGCGKRRTKSSRCSAAPAAARA